MGPVIRLGMGFGSLVLGSRGDGGPRVKRLLERRNGPQRVLRRFQELWLPWSPKEGPPMWTKGVRVGTVRRDDHVPADETPPQDQVGFTQE